MTSITPIGPANSATALPLVSCIMPTKARPDWLPQAIRYFQKQDYPNRELIIVDTSPDGLGCPIGDDARVRHHRISPSHTIGAMRNIACEAARGDIVVLWDDDDWYAPQRISAQVQPILDGRADITAITDTVFFDLDRWEFWRCSPALHRRMWAHDAVCGTVAFRRSLYGGSCRYPDRSAAEDAAFLESAVRQGARLMRIASDGLFAYVRHAANSWKFECGKFFEAAAWRREDEPRALAADRAFYAARSRALMQAAAPAPVCAPPVAGDAGHAEAAAGQPLVSCIMPTADRRRFVPDAIAQFLAQDYPVAELVILDDGDDAVADLVPSHPALRYVRTPRHRTLGCKRNAACEAARGDIILHWDDDDWYAPQRIRVQVEALSASRADLCGIDRVLFFDPRAPAAWEYVYPRVGAPWVYGGAMCYRRDYWRAHPFPDINVGEDSQFAAAARPDQVCVLPDNRFYVALVHAANTSPKQVHDPRWQPRPVETIAALTRGDWPDAGAPSAPTAASRGERPAPSGLRQGVSVVIPHGGIERLPHLATSLANLRQCRGVDEIIVVDMGPSPIAREPARRWNAKYVFVRNDGSFERGRALDVGSTLATHDLVLWLDNDLLMNGDFIVTAAIEIRDRRLDFLIPYVCIDYLSESDSRAVMDGLQNPIRCAPARSLTPGGLITGGAGIVRNDFLRRHGGFPQGFRGWGCEDNGWAHKAAVLGASGISTNRDQRLYHLYHARSGAHDATVHHQNPHYADNLNLFARIAAIRDKRQFLEQFPPSTVARPWAGDREIVFVEPPQHGEHQLAGRAASGLRELLDIDIVVVEADDDAQWLVSLPERRPDAAVIFDRGCAVRLLKRQDLKWLHDRAIVVVDATGMPGAADTQLLECAAAYCVSSSVSDSADGAHGMVFTFAADAAPLDIGVCVVQALSVVLGAEVARDKPRDHAVRIGVAEQSRAAVNRYRDTKLAAEQVSFYLSAVADVAPTRLLEVGSELGRWAALLGDRSSAGCLEFHGIALTPDHSGDQRCGSYRTVSRGDFRAPLKAENRHWDLLIVSDALSAWPLDVGIDLVADATGLADYVLIWDWGAGRQRRPAPDPSTVREAQPWSSWICASRVGAVEDCQYGAFLLSRMDPRGIGRRNANAELFERAYRTRAKVADEAEFYLTQTAELRRKLPHLLQSVDARSLLDAPCGDFVWMQRVTLGLDDYIGVDIVSDVVAQNQSRYGATGRRFIRADITCDDLPGADVILCRDCLMYLSYDDIERVLRNFKRSGSTYLLTTTFTKLRANSDIVTGGWRTLNPQLPPFGFPDPIKLVVEGCTEAGGRYADKSLALWRLSDIA